MTTTRMIWGTLVATLMAGGTAIYYGEHRSTHKIIDVATLTEMVNKRNAARGHGGWPFTNNFSTNVGWYAHTNVLTATNWSFNGYTVVPFFGSSIPRTAINETLDQITDMVPDFVESAYTNETPVTTWGVNVTNKDIGFNMLTVTGLWARLNIGNGTSLWTIAYTTNGLPIYSNHIGSILSTTTLFEAYRVLTNCFKTPGPGLEFPVDTNVFATVTGISPTPFAPIHPVAYSDMPPHFYNSAYANNLAYYNEYYGGHNWYYVEYVYMAGGNPVYRQYDFARMATTGSVWTASFPTNVSCSVKTWLIGYWGELGDDQMWHVLHEYDNTMTFTGLDTNTVSELVVPQSDLSNWGDFLTAHGVTMTNYINEAQYNVYGAELLTWDFHD